MNGFKFFASLMFVLVCTVGQENGYAMFGVGGSAGGGVLPHTVVWKAPAMPRLPVTLPLAATSPPTATATTSVERRASTAPQRWSRAVGILATKLLKASSLLAKDTSPPNLEMISLMIDMADIVAKDGDALMKAPIEDREAVEVRRQISGAIKEAASAMRQTTQKALQGVFGLLEYREKPTGVGSSLYHVSMHAFRIAADRAMSKFVEIERLLGRGEISQALMDLMKMVKDARWSQKALKTVRFRVDAENPPWLEDSDMEDALDEFEAAFLALKGVCELEWIQDHRAPPEESKEEKF